MLQLFQQFVHELLGAIRIAAADMPRRDKLGLCIDRGPCPNAASAVRGISTARDIMEEKAPLRRNVTQDEVGNVGLFLASPLSTCVTGETIYADCGFNIMAIA